MELRGPHHRCALRGPLCCWDFRGSDTGLLSLAGGQNLAPGAGVAGLCCSASGPSLLHMAGGRDLLIGAPCAGLRGSVHSASLLCAVGGQGFLLGADLLSGSLGCDFCTQHCQPMSPRIY